MGSINKINPGLPEKPGPFRILAGTEIQIMPGDKGGKLQIIHEDDEFFTPPEGAQVIRAIRANLRQARALGQERIIIFDDDTGKFFNVSADTICEVH